MSSIFGEELNGVIDSHMCMSVCVYIFQHAATVLLYHPCAPLHERLLLSGLARSCLLDYIITPHLQLSNHTVRQALYLSSLTRKRQHAVVELELFC